MSAAVTPQAAEAMAVAAEPHPGRYPGRRRRRRRVALAGTAAAVAAAGMAIAVTGPFSGPGASGAPGNAAGTSLATVTRQTLQSQTSLNATLGYAGYYSVAGKGGGTITWLPAAGQVIRQGQVLYRVDNGTPVFLLYGRVPAWRALSEGMSGADVRQLNHDLVKLGYANSADISPLGWDYFSWETRAALELLQQHLGLPQTGTLPLGQAVFLPSAVRVTSVTGSLGGPAGGMVLQGSSTRRVVTIALDAAQQSEVAVGNRVAITLPDGRVTPGVVSSVGSVATGGSTPTITVQVTPSDPRAVGTLDQAPVTVSITAASAPDALVVPVDALLARSGGGYAVEEVSGGGRHYLVPVSLGLFDDADGLVQVTGPGLAAGQRVVVPTL
ncbi:MAG TPA: peptidoglycan-binding protein [Streptosporangiaceae bacterium]|nr:peptidoglycan-binding protein [Streptosporangiaceae bacterium]